MYKRRCHPSHAIPTLHKFMCAAQGAWSGIMNVSGGPRSKPGSKENPAVKCKYVKCDRLASSCCRACLKGKTKILICETAPASRELVHFPEHRVDIS